MSRRKNTEGAGSIPAPSGGPEQAMVETAETLRALLREARGVLGDLTRERKAIEQLARDRAEKVIETHVNDMMAQLSSHVDTQYKVITEQLRQYFAAMVKNWTGSIDVERLVAATELVERLHQLAQEEERKLHGGS